MGRGGAGERDGKARGELGELRSQLTALSGGGSSPERINQKRELFRKIIMSGTIGQDMSGLFMQVITCAASDAQDVVLKKSLYLYITTWATANPELMLLTINMLLKDCGDQDPTIRGLALRSLCSLRISNLTEYLMSPIQRGLKDRHPYVRRTAVMGVLKVYNFDADAVRNAGMLETVREMLTQDADPMVVSNCMSVIQKAGGAKELLSKTLLYSLVNRIKDFSEWAQCQVLEFVSRYRPADADEVYDIMNALDDRLTTPNSAVVLAAVRVFLNMTLSMPYDHQQVLERIKDPLMTLVSRDHHETAYAVLAHFLIIAQRAPLIFASIYPTFFCRMNDPSYVKDLKLQLLSAVADESNAYEIVTELTEYVADIDEHQSREAVRAVGRIALEVQDVGGIVERLLGFLEMGRDHVTAETLIQVKDLLRRYPEVSEAALAAVAAISPADVAEPEARAAFVWILGHHGGHIQDAPYLLEPLAQQFADEEVPVRLALLTAALKLFFARPPECQTLLGAALAAAVADADQDVRDRGLMYYRLLRHGADAAAKVAGTEIPSISAFSEEQSPEVRDRVFEDFNSLAVVYRMPASSFIKADENVGEEELFAVGPGAATADSTPPRRSAAAAASDGELGAKVTTPAAADPGASLLSDHEQADALLDVSPAQNGSAAAATPTSPAVDPMGDLLGLGDLLGGAAAAPAPPPAAPPPPPRMQLQPSPQLSPAHFQQLWEALPPAASFQAALQPSAVSATQTNHLVLCNYVAPHGIGRVASGGNPPRFYLHAQPSSGDGLRVLVEVVVNPAASVANVTLKAQDAAFAGPFEQILLPLLQQFS